MLSLPKTLREYPTASVPIVTLPAEFQITNDNQLVLLDIPAENQKIIIIRKQGKIWSDLGTRLADSDNDIAKFLRATTVDLPG